MTTIGEVMSEHQKLKQAKRLALDYSRNLPTRPCSPYGHLIIDCEAVQEAFRLCYEELLKRKLKV